MMRLHSQHVAGCLSIGRAMMGNMRGSPQWHYRNGFLYRWLIANRHEATQEQQLTGT
jgi:hypothetical protein